MSEQRWGLLDMQDNVWMGDTTAPFLFRDREEAREAARVLTERLGWYHGRILTVSYDGSGIQMRDTVGEVAQRPSLKLVR